MKANKALFESKKVSSVTQLLHRFGAQMSAVPSGSVYFKMLNQIDFGTTFDLQIGSILETKSVFFCTTFWAPKCSKSGDLKLLGPTALILVLLVGGKTFVFSCFFTTFFCEIGVLSAVRFRKWDQNTKGI